MSTDNLLLASVHPLSQRVATFEDDGTSAWLYLSESESQKPVSDIWVFNRIAAPPTSQIRNYRGGPPPAAQGFAGTDALCQAPSNHQWQLHWSDDGHGAAVLRDQQPVAFVVAGEKHGWSANLIQGGPWGNVWDQQQYQLVFGS